MKKVEANSKNINLEQIANEWLEAQKKVLNKNSFAVYKSEIYKYIIPSLGEIRTWWNWVLWLYELCE